MVRLVAEGAEEGYFVEACRSCRGYLKGVDRRQRWNAGAPVVEDWASPHLDVYATRQGYWRAPPSLVHPLPPEGGPAAGKPAASAWAPPRSSLAPPPPPPRPPWGGAASCGGW